MDKVASLPASQRQELFSETAARMNLLPGLVEKDFWVCWTLKQLFSIPSLKSRLLFKGGTTLSKIFGVIQRFSEDIDLVVDRDVLGFKGERDPLRGLSSKKLNMLLKEMRKTCVEYIATDFLSTLQERVAARLQHEQDAWKLSVDPDDEQAVSFFYPATTEQVSYVRPAVRLELGARGDFVPNDRYSITPYAAEHFPEVFDDPACPVRAITVERTFWEKATILHQEYHRKEAHGPPERCSRHYYDVFMLASRDDILRAALGAEELLAAVVEHKKRFFRSAWARYELAVPATLKVMPSPVWQDFLREDYGKMDVMLFGDVPSFDEILSDLSVLEEQIRMMGSGKTPAGD